MSESQNYKPTANDLACEKSKLEFYNKPIETLSKLERLRHLSLKNSENYGVNWTNHCLSTLPIHSVSRILHYNEIYQKILSTPGVICEFGIQWGAGLAQLSNLRNIYEPYNVSRVIYGFDTFSGFAGVSDKDQGLVNDGDYFTKTSYVDELCEILDIHESFQPKANHKRTFLIKGDVSDTFEKWLDNNPHAIISLAIFDMDIYLPTKNVLQMIVERLTKGSILVFDEMNYPGFPGETEAVREVLGLKNIKLIKTPFQSYSSYLVFE